MPYLSSISLAINRPGGLSLESQVAALFSGGEQGAWYDPSAANVTWRRNLLTRTEEFDNAAWTRSNFLAFGSGSTANATTAPDGTSTADLLCVASGNNLKEIYQLQGTATNGDTYVMSVYAKAGTHSYLQLAFSTTSFGANAYANFDLSGAGAKGTVGSAATADIQAVPGYPGWFRCIVVATASAQVTNNFWHDMAFVASATAARFAALNAAGTESMYLWGAQLERGSVVTPYQRIVTPELTYLADVQSQPLLFTDAAGTTPVVGVESPVGLILDKRKGLVLGSELVTNGDFATASNWTLTANASITGGVLSVNAAAGVFENFAYQSGTSAAINKWYKVTVDVTRSAGALSFFIGGVSVGDRVFNSLTASGAYTAIFYATANTQFTFRCENGFTGTIDNVSVKLLDGNHAYQTSSAARPVLRARYNLLTYSEDYSNAVWVKTNLTRTTGVADPFGGTSATTLTASGGSGRIYIAVSVVANANYTGSFYIRRRTGTGDINWEAFTVGVGALITTTGSWTRVTVTGNTPSTTAYFGIRIATVGDEIDVFAADFRPGTSAGTYQRIAAATDYATGAAFPVYLEQPTGGDDSLITANSSFNDFAASDAPFYMAAGVTRYGTTRGTVFCLADNTNATAGNNDTVNLECDSTAQVRGYLLDYDAGGNTEVPATAGTLAAEQTFVASWQRTDTDGFARRNGTAGTGADQSAPALTLPLATVMAQRRGSSPTTDQRFTGRLFGLVVRAGAINAGQMSAVENYLAGKAGITL